MRGIEVRGEAVRDTAVRVTEDQGHSGTCHRRPGAQRYVSRGTCQVALRYVSSGPGAQRYVSRGTAVRVKWARGTAVRVKWHSGTEHTQQESLEALLAFAFIPGAWVD